MCVFECFGVYWMNVCRRRASKRYTNTWMAMCVSEAMYVLMLYYRTVSHSRSTKPYTNKPLGTIFSISRNSTAQHNRTERNRRIPVSENIFEWESKESALCFSLFLFVCLLCVFGWYDCLLQYNSSVEHVPNELCRWYAVQTKERNTQPEREKIERNFTEKREYPSKCTHTVHRTCVLAISLRRLSEMLCIVRRARSHSIAFAWMWATENVI